MMTHDERQHALDEMRAASNTFYAHAVRIGNHPFIEFTGLMNEYILSCQNAHDKGVDFSACSTHTGNDLPMPAHSVDYVNEKLECIFTGRSVMQANNRNQRPA